MYCKTNLEICRFDTESIIRKRTETDIQKNRTNTRKTTETDIQKNRTNTRKRTEHKNIRFNKPGYSIIYQWPFNQYKLSYENFGTIIICTVIPCERSK